MPGRGDDIHSSSLQAHSSLASSSIDPLSWAVGGDDVRLVVPHGTAARAFASDIVLHTAGRGLA